MITEFPVRITRNDLAAVAAKELDGGRCGGGGRRFEVALGGVKGRSDHAVFR